MPQLQKSSSRSGLKICLGFRSAAGRIPDEAHSPRGRRGIAAASVENALATLAADTDLVAVHDAVRPFIDLPTIERVINEAQQTGAAIVGSCP